MEHLYPIQLTADLEYYTKTPKPWWVFLDDGIRFRYRKYVRDCYYYLWEAPISGTRITIPSMAEHEFNAGPYSLHFVSFDVESQCYCASIKLYANCGFSPTDEEMYVKQMDETMSGMSWAVTNSPRLKAGASRRLTPPNCNVLH